MENFGEKVHHTKDGERIKICQMSDRHLINTIKMKWRESKNLKDEWIQVSFDEAYPANFSTCLSRSKILRYVLEADFRGLGKDSRKMYYIINYVKHSEL